MKKLKGTWRTLPNSQPVSLFRLPVTSHLSLETMTSPVSSKRASHLLTSVDSYEPRKITRNLL
ncbi:rCG33849, partial [Rattus norvegicus]